MRTPLSLAESRVADRILGMVAALHRIEPDDIVGPSQVSAMMAARRDVAWVLRAAGLSTPKIGTVLDRDHTSVLYLLRTADREQWANF